MLARIGEALPRCQMYERLFATHEKVLAALSNVYVDVLNFCVEAKDVFLAAPRESAREYISVLH